MTLQANSQTQVLEEVWVHIQVIMCLLLPTIVATKLKPVSLSILFGPEKLSVGDHIEKDRFTFGYKINDIEKFWGHWETILKFFMASLILLAVWLSPFFRPE
jgi:hypothetical protein